MRDPYAFTERTVMHSLVGFVIALAVGLTGIGGGSLLRLRSSMLDRCCVAPNTLQNFDKENLLSARNYLYRHRRILAHFVHNRR
jgi:hypothetical protein